MTRTYTPWFNTAVAGFCAGGAVAHAFDGDAWGVFFAGLLGLLNGAVAAIQAIHFKEFSP